MSTVRVCHLIHALDRGGAEDVLVELAAAAPAAGLDLSVVALTPLAGAVNAPRLEALGIQVRGLELASRWDPRGPGRALQLVAPLQPQVVHSHLKHADLVGAYVAARLGVPHVSTLHVIEDEVDGIRRVKRFLAGTVRARTAGHTVAVSEATASWAQGQYRVAPDRLSVIRNGVGDLVTLAPGCRAALREDVGVPPGGCMVLMAAFMRPGKGHLDLLEAARQVLQDHDAWFVLAGDGPLQPEVEAVVAADVGLRERVRTLGFRADVTSLLQACDVVVHPSHADALPTALIQAQAAARPVVATRVGGVPEVVASATGRLVPPGDVAALAAALTEVVADPALRARLGAAGRARYEAEFRADAWARALHELYRGLVDQHPGPTGRRSRVVRALGFDRAGHLHGRRVPGAAVGVGAPPPAPRPGPG